MNSFESRDGFPADGRATIETAKPTAAMISDHLRDRNGAVPVRSLVGLDGFAMLALSLAVAAASGGLTIAAACAHAFAVARRTLPSAAGDAVLVLGMRSRRGVP